MYFNIVFNFIYNIYLIKCGIFISQHLGLLRCGDATVIYALKERMKSDEELDKDKQRLQSNLSK
jgi:hypothetical protein